MISISVWKRELERPRSNPRSGPASHAGQPPLRAGTYCEGAEAAPALIRNTLVSTPTRPSAPSTPMARPDVRVPRALSWRAGRCGASAAGDLEVAA
jgi:hypothetical protein